MKVNHVREEGKLTCITTLAEGAIAMLLMNFIVEVGLFDDASSTIVDICYESREGPRMSGGSLPCYVLVNFPDIKAVDGYTPWDEDIPTYVPRPVVTIKYECKSFSMTMIPLQVCKAISQYKAQGMTVGFKELYERLASIFPSLSSQLEKKNMN